MLSARLGHFLDAPLGFIAKTNSIQSERPLSNRIYYHCHGSIRYSAQSIRLGGIFILIGGIFDMLDGIVARTTGKATKFGAFLDSVLDRYSDAFLFLSIAWYLAAHGDHTGSFLSIGTLSAHF